MTSTFALDDWLEFLHGPAFVVSKDGVVVGSNKAARVPFGALQRPLATSFAELPLPERQHLVEQAPTTVRLSNVDFLLSPSAENDHVVARMALESQPYTFVSGESRRDLHSLIGLSDLLADTDLSLPQRRLVEGIADHARHLFDHVANMQELEQMRDHRLQLHAGAHRLSDIIDKVITSVRESRRLGSVELTSTLAPGVPRGVVVDGERMRELLFLLVENGVAAAKSRVHIDVSATEDELHIAVVDDGSGVPLSEQSQLFLPYRRQGPGGVSRGTGFGLLLARNLTAQMGGRIWYDPADLRGSAFHCIVPRQDATAEEFVPLPSLRRRELRIIVAGPDDERCHFLQQQCVGSGSVCGRVESVDALEALLEESLDAGRPYHLALLCLRDESVSTGELSAQLLSTFRGLKVLEVGERPSPQALWADVYRACERVPRTVRPSPFKQRALTANERVLVVDPQSARRWLIRRVLQDAGFDVDAVSTPETARRAFTAVQHTLLVVDGSLRLHGVPLIHALLHADVQPRPGDTQVIAIGPRNDEAAPASAAWVPTPLRRQGVLDAIDRVQRNHPITQNTRTFELQLAALARAVAQGDWSSSSRIVDEARSRLSQEALEDMRAAIDQKSTSAASRTLARLRADLGRSEPSQRTKHTTGEFTKETARLAVERLIPAYLDERAADLEVLKAAVTELNFASVRQVAHRVAGTGTTFGFPELTQLGVRLHKAADQKDGKLLAQLVDAFDHFLQQAQDGREQASARLAALLQPSS